MQGFNAQRCLALGMAAFFLLSSEVSHSQEFSYQSWNFRTRYMRHMRHKNFLGYLEPVADAQAAKDMDFIRVPALAKSPELEGPCYSFQARSVLGGPAGFFLRHQNFRIVLSKFSPEDKTFREDATFCITRPLNRVDDQNAFSFESVNFSQHFIRHRNFELFLNPNDRSESFANDATFIQTSPVHPSVRID